MAPAAQPPLKEDKHTFEFNRGDCRVWKDTVGPQVKGSAILLHIAVRKRKQAMERHSAGLLSWRDASQRSEWIFQIVNAPAKRKAHISARESCDSVNFCSLNFKLNLQGNSDDLMFAAAFPEATHGRVGLRSILSSVCFGLRHLDPSSRREVGSVDSSLGRIDLQ